MCGLKNKVKSDIVIMDVKQEVDRTYDRLAPSWALPRSKEYLSIRQNLPRYHMVFTNYNNSVMV